MRRCWPDFRPRRLAILTFGLSLGGCFADAGYAVTVDGAYVDEPPPGFIATAPPFYYEGRPTYWYGGHWHYRDAEPWSHYHSEPAPLRGYRMNMGGPRRAPPFYEQSPRGRR